MTETTVTPEMIEAADAFLNPKAPPTDNELTAAYEAMKAIDPELVRMRRVEEVLGALCNGIGSRLWDEARSLLDKRNVSRAEALRANFRAMHGRGQ